MNDRAVSLLEQYELTIHRTYKGRGAILCDTDRGLKILMEYPCPREKITLQDALLRRIRDAGAGRVEQIVRSREDELLCVDADQTAYVLKDYFTGRECGVREPADCKRAVARLAKLHRVMLLPPGEALRAGRRFSLAQELAKRTRELKKVYKFLKARGQRGAFELSLLHHYDLFYEKACAICAQVEAQEAAEDGCRPEAERPICHGDYQYHNVLLDEDGEAVVRFEKCMPDSQMRDLCLFLRKVLEKSNWDIRTALSLLEAYDREKTLTAADRRQLYYRFAYPEKFWKIVNFYYNSGKAWIPEKNTEKLTRVLEQEENRERFLREIFPG